MPEVRDSQLPDVPEGASGQVVLAAELDQDPLAWGYAAMSDQEATDRLNYLAADPSDPLARSYAREVFSAAELYEALDSDELEAKHIEANAEKVAFQANPYDPTQNPTGVEQDRWPKMVELAQILTLSDGVPVSAKNTQDRILRAMNNPGSTVTRQNLADMKVILQTRAQELGLPNIRVGWVTQVRAV